MTLGELGKMDQPGATPTGFQGSQVILMKNGSGCLETMPLPTGKGNGMMAVKAGLPEHMATSVK